MGILMERTSKELVLPLELIDESLRSDRACCPCLRRYRSKQVVQRCQEVDISCRPLESQIAVGQRRCSDTCERALCCRLRQRCTSSEAAR